MPIISPLTGAQDVSLLRAFKADKLVADWQNTFQIDIRAELRGHEDVFLYECQRTGLKFFYPPDLQGSARLYEELQKFPWFYIPDKWEHEKALQRISGTDRVLEVGSGTGAFVAKCLQKGADITGLELNCAAIAEAQRSGLPVKNEDLSQFIEGKEGYFDAGCAFQVLEHVSDPRSFLGNLTRALKKGGYLLVSVPNNDSFLRHDHNLLDMPPHHMTQWNRRSLCSLQQVLPIRLMRIAYEPLEKYHVEYFINVYHAYIRRRFRLHNGLPKRLLLPAAWLLNSGFRKVFRGQGCLAEYVKT